MKYNPITDNFTSFEAVPEVKVSIPLLNINEDISDWSSRITNEGVPIVKDNLNDPFIRDTSETIQTPSNTNISFEDLVKQENLPIKITSGFRDSNGFRGGKTKSGRQSNHNKRDEYGNSMAYDIVPLNGNFEDLLNKLYSNPRVVNWLKSKGYGILEETTPEIMRKTGATGRHLHIGPDTSALAMTQKRLKAAKGLKFPFMSFEAVETPKIELPLFDQPFDISEWSSGVTKEGIPIAKDNLHNPFIKDNTTTVETVQPTVQSTVPTSPGESTLSKIIDEVSNESGYEGLKDQQMKNLLLLQAKRESNFNPRARSKSSSASGYFQFVDGTRQAYSSLTRDQFLNDPKEQVRAAYKNLTNIFDSSNAKALLQKGYNKAQVAALGWWYPKSMNMVLEGNTDYSKGGYSIKQALFDYQS